MAITSVDIVPTDDGKTWSLDMNEAKFVELKVSRDGRTVWVNTESGCVLRISHIDNGVKVEDARMM